MKTTATDVDKISIGVTKSVLGAAAGRGWNREIFVTDDAIIIVATKKVQGFQILLWIVGHGNVSWDVTQTIPSVDLVAEGSRLKSADEAIKAAMPAIAKLRETAHAHA